jgi:hypothetical protein
MAAVGRTGHGQDGMGARRYESGAREPGLLSPCSCPPRENSLRLGFAADRRPGSALPLRLRLVLIGRLPTIIKREPMGLPTP